MEATIGVGASVIAAVISGVILRKVDTAQKKNDKREAERDEREELTLEALNATFCVNKELVRCVRGEKPNGELTEAFRYQQNVKHKIEDYLRKKAAH